MPTTRSASSRSEAMYALIQEYLDQPDITQREFCLNHQIAYSTFQLYLRKVRQSQIIPKSTEATGRFFCTDCYFDLSRSAKKEGIALSSPIVISGCKVFRVCPIPYRKLPIQEAVIKKNDFSS